MPETFRRRQGCACDRAADWIRSTFADENEWTWAFALNEENKVIGTGSIGPNAQMKGDWGIGYHLRYDDWHKGYCTEAMRAIIGFAHEALGVNRICSYHAVEDLRKKIIRPYPRKSRPA